jgi:hypothetical protein
MYGRGLCVWSSEKLEERRNIRFDSAHADPLKLSGGIRECYDHDRIDQYLAKKLHMKAPLQKISSR